MDIYQFLADHSIEYERHDHPPVYTCEEALRLVPPCSRQVTNIRPARIEIQTLRVWGNP